MTKTIIVVLVTCPSPTIGRRLARHIISRRLAACVNMVPAVQSTYRWQGKVEQARETLLIIKSTRRLFERLRRAILAQHPYDVPEIIALPVAAGHRPYLGWVRQSVFGGALTA